jgi:poly-gamma-glutamate synthesis protein (capsule biosynthesis protein)
MHEGFARTRELLRQMDIRWCAAGDNITEAFQPAMVECNGITLAFLGTVDGSSGMHRFAGQAESGVAPNDTETVCEVIKTLRVTADYIIISPHWGKERFRIPSPGQIEQAHAFVDAGASMVLGHHPHVLQGMEIYREAPIAYSLGNFIAGNVYWDDGDMLTWNRFERTSCIFIAEFDRNGVKMVRQIPVMDDGNRVRIETSGWGDRCLRRANRLLARGISEKRYRSEAFRVLKLMPILSHLRWSELRKICSRHLRKALRVILPGKE